ncbi:Ubiquitin-like-specific protease ESD4-like protein [Drosera capensis]
MGALTSNRKRADEYANVNTTWSSLIDSRVLKKQKVSSFEMNSKKGAGWARVEKYPVAKELKREPIAPCTRKFGVGFVGRKRVGRAGGVNGVDGVNGVGISTIDRVGYRFRGKYVESKASASGTLQCLKIVKEVEEKGNGKVGRRDSSVEEIVVVEDDGVDEVDTDSAMLMRGFQEKKASRYGTVRGLDSGWGMEGKGKAGSRGSSDKKIVAVKDNGLDEVDVFMFKRRFQEKDASGHRTIQGLERGKVVEDKGKEKTGLKDFSVEEIGVVVDEMEGSVVVSDVDMEKDNMGSLETMQMAGSEVVDKEVVPVASAGVRKGNILESIGRLVSSWYTNIAQVVKDPPAYRKLLNIAARRDPKLSSLQAQIKLEEKQLHSLQSLRLVKKPEQEDSLRELFVPLTREEEENVAQALRSNSKKVLVTHEGSNIQITGELIQCLRPGAWLNDEVINLYLELLKERERRDPKKFLKCHFLNTFFYKKLIGGRGGYDYKSVRRWTTQRKLGYGLLDCEKIFVPIHQEVHWCLAIINKKEQKFQYLDSLGGRDTKVLRVLEKYYVDEVKDKNGEDIDVSSWSYDYIEDLPHQENGSDCGMFMIKYTDFYSRGLGLLFSQSHAINHLLLYWTATLLTGNESITGNYVASLEENNSQLTRQDWEGFRRLEMDISKKFMTGLSCKYAMQVEFSAKLRVLAGPEIPVHFPLRVE